MKASCRSFNCRSHEVSGCAYLHILHIFCRELVVYDDAVLGYTGHMWISLFQTYLEKKIRDQLALQLGSTGQT